MPSLPDRGAPQSLVSASATREIVSPLGDYGTVADLTPSFVSSAPIASKNLTAFEGGSESPPGARRRPFAIYRRASSNM